MSENGAGITKIYNQVNSSEQQQVGISALRDVHCQIDVAVARAYGWDDIGLEHGFHEIPYLPENDRIRFTISETARIEVLRRLSELNRKRYEEEIAAGLHSDATSRKTKSAPKGKSVPKKSTESTTQAGLDFGNSSGEGIRRLHSDHIEE